MSVWNKISDYGVEKLKTAPQRRRHRIGNQLLAIVVLVNLGIGALELLLYGILLSRDSATYFGYAFAYTIPSLAMNCFAIGAYYFKNKTQDMDWSFLAVVPLVVYIGMFCVFLGAELMVHIIFFVLIPIPFFIYGHNYVSRIVLQEAVIIAGIVLSLLSYLYVKPLFALPADLAQIFRIVPFLTVILMLVLVSYYYWRQTLISDTQMLQEKRQLEDLLNNIIPRHKQAEKKYRNLVEGSGDIIFSLDADGRIKTINKALRTHLAFNPDEALQKPFEDYVFVEGERETSIEAALFRGYLRDVIQEQKTHSFRMALRHKYQHEAVELSFTLEYTETEGEVEILGKATSVQQDLILHFLQREKGRYTIGNSIAHAEILSHKLTRNLVKVFSTTEVQALRISLREILVNAIEHGNLAVTYEEKTDAQQDGDFLEFLRMRQQDPRYKDRKVLVEYLFDQNKVAYQITDEGAGFDHAVLLSDDSDSANENFLSHGRGITMTKNIFDLVRYNETGNRVLLVKHLSETEVENIPKEELVRV